MSKGSVYLSNSMIETVFESVYELCFFERFGFQESNPEIVMT